MTMRCYDTEADVVEYDLSGIEKEVDTILDMPDDDVCEIYNVGTKSEAITCVIDEGYNSRFFVNYPDYKDYIRDNNRRLWNLFIDNLKKF